jgi:signal transduction histidine kinase
MHLYQQMITSFNQTKNPIMNQAEISRNRVRLNNYSPSAIRFNYLTKPKVVQGRTGQFTSVMAHEIRNPLTSINLAAQMLQSLATDDNQKVYLDIIMRSSVRINDMITDLLTPAVAEGTPHERYSIDQLLDEVLVITGDRLLLKNITVIKKYSTQESGIIMDRSKMKIALTNIIINAIDAMPSENGQLKLVTRSLNGKWVIEINDNGTGISKKNLKTMFNPYVTNKPGGMGLGLSTTLDILQANHARASVQSEEGKGTRFILSFDRISAWQAGVS